MKKLLLFLSFSFLTFSNLYSQISGPTNVCPSTSYSYSVTIAGGGFGAGTYKWYINGVNQRFNNTPSTTLTMPASGTSFTISAVYTPDVGSVETYYFTSYGSAPGTAAIDLTNVCYGTYVGLSLSGQSGTNASWEKKEGAGAWTDTYVSATTLSVAVYQNTIFRRKLNDCGILYSNEVSVTVSPQPTGGAMQVGSSQLCSSGTASLTLSGYVGTISEWQVRSKDGPGAWGSWSVFSTSSSSTNSYSVSAATNDDRTYEFKGKLTSGVCSPAFSSVATVTVYSQTDAGSISSNNLLEAYGTSSATLTLNNAKGTITKWQKKEGSTITDITNTALSYAYSNITATTDYRAVVQSGTCPTANSPFISIQVYAVPSIVFDGQQNITIGGSSGMHTNSVCTSYQWIKNGVDMPGETASSINVTTPATYKLRVKQTATSPTYTTGNAIIGEALGSQLDTMNYISAISFLKAGVTESTSLYSLAAAELNYQIQYFDGVGRVSQTNSIGSSPLGKDVIQPAQYDLLGTVKKEFLPLVSTQRTGVYNPNALKTSYTSSDQYLFYQNADKVAHDTAPYSLSMFEPSALGRPEKQFGAGQAWQSNNKFIEHGYSVNSTSLESIINWVIDSSTGLPIRNSLHGFYDSDALTITSSKDEHGNEVREYKNMLGQVILKKVQYVASPTLNNKDHWAQTYYVYDDFGNLAYVLPPELTKIIYQNTTYNPTAADLNNWAFQYKYDGRKRMVEKRVPGAEPVYMVYDNRDRLVLTQDGNQRAAKQWLFTKYDSLNRPVATGLYTHDSIKTQQQMASKIKNLRPARLCEIYNNSPYKYGYSNAVFPTANLNYFTVTYYDTYDFNNADQNFGFTTGELTGQEPDYVIKPLGSVTGSLVKVISGDPYWMKAITYYDKRSRPIQNISDHGRSGIERTTNVYDFAGKVLKTKTKHTDNRLSWTNLTATQVKQDKVIQTGGSGVWGTANAASVESLPANTNGWVEATLSASSHWSTIGLGSQRNANGASDTDYSFFMSNEPSCWWNLIIKEPAGFVYFAPDARVTYGDRIRIERVGTTVVYKFNDQVVYTSPTASSGTLYVNTAMADPAGSYVYKPRSSFSVKTNTITRRFEYDHAGRLLRTFHEVDNTGELMLVANEYNELGQLIDKKLHSTDPTNTTEANRHYKQSLDYQYNIRGWLTKVNEPNVRSTANLAADGPKIMTDLFGMELGYNNDIGTGNTALYNGNISSMKWSSNQSFGLVKDVAYNYAYDPLNRILSATYKKDTTNGWTNPSNGFNESGYSYDQNGNIMGLTRRGLNGASMDVLSYDYGSTASNKLLNVSDAADKTKGFIEPAPTSGNDYAYDANGNMTRDNNKKITGIYYNHLNLPVYLTKDNGDALVYTYDATGRKLSQEIFNSSWVSQKISDYSGEYFYENDTLKFINHEEGRIIISAAAPEYQYHLKDHLGNVRATFTTKSETEQSTGTLETANLVPEQEKFLRYANAKRVNAAIFDHTNGTSTGYSERLNGSANEKYGLARSLSVMAGDTILMEVYAKYVDPNSGNWTGALSTLVSQIAANTAGVVIDGTAYGNSTSSFPAGYGTAVSKTDNGAPKAYLNWLIFDRNHKYITGGFKQITTAAKEAGSDVVHEKVTPAGGYVAITEPGYVYVYLSNEETDYTREVYFDDFKVTHVKSPVIATNDYYPFGLTFNGYERENSVANRSKFNGMEESQDLGINWLMPSKFRIYDPAIGRFNGIDPLADKSNNISSYAFAMNNPLLYNDLIGADTTKTTMLQEVVVTAKRYAETSYNWFMGYDVGYTGSGWGHGPRRWSANQMGLGNNANNLFGLGLHSLLQSSQVNLSGQLLNKIRRDPAMVKFQNDIIKALKSDPRFKNMSFVTSGKGVVEFGGRRWSSSNENWSALDDSNPLAHGETWDVAGNELTWATRHGTVGYSATVKSDGTIVVDFHLSDTLDLSGQKGRSEAYNNISNATGFMYHDVVGGNSNIKVNADWQVTEQ